MKEGLFEDDISDLTVKFVIAANLLHKLFTDATSSST